MKWREAKKKNRRKPASIQFSRLWFFYFAANEDVDNWLSAEEEKKAREILCHWPFCQLDLERRKEEEWEKIANSLWRCLESGQVAKSQKSKKVPTPFFTSSSGWAKFVWVPQRNNAVETKDPLQFPGFDKIKNGKKLNCFTLTMANDSQPSNLRLWIWTQIQRWVNSSFECCCCRRCHGSCVNLFGRAINVHLSKLMRSCEIFFFGIA